MTISSPTAIRRDRLSPAAAQENQSEHSGSPATISAGQNRGDVPG